MRRADVLPLLGFLWKVVSAYWAWRAQRNELGATLAHDRGDLVRAEKLRGRAERQRTKAAGSRRAKR